MSYIYIACHMENLEYKDLKLICSLSAYMTEGLSHENR